MTKLIEMLRKLEQERFYGSLAIEFRGRYHHRSQGTNNQTRQHEEKPK